MDAIAEMRRRLEAERRKRASLEASKGSIAKAVVAALNGERPR